MLLFDDISSPPFLPAEMYYICNSIYKNILSAVYIDVAWSEETYP